MATVVLDWYSSNKRLTGGLRSKLKKSETLIDGKTRFTTIRLGTKWLDKLNPLDYVAVSISNEPNKLNIVGYAMVKNVSKTTLHFLYSSDLKFNIGAKKVSQALKDMRSVYGKDRVNIYSVITVIELLS